jgi:hypothetical protein
MSVAPLLNFFRKIKEVRCQMGKLQNVEIILSTVKMSAKNVEGKMSTMENVDNEKYRKNKMSTVEK